MASLNNRTYVRSPAAPWTALALLLLPLNGLAGELAQDGAVAAEAKLAAKAIQIPAGFHLATVASEPNLANPVAFCFDPLGRIFVAETYRVKQGVEDNRGHMDWLDDDLAAGTVADRVNYVKRHMGEKIQLYATASEQVRLLEDRDSDGIYEFSSVYSTDYKNVEDGVAAGVMWVRDRLWFTCIPSLWELRDADGDGQAEQKHSLATGFGVRTSFYGHDLHGLCQGPDGKIYFSIGDRGLHVETPEGVLSHPGTGAILRCNPDGGKLEIFATGLRNPQELAFNELGDLFTVDNNCDSGDRARLIYVVEGMDVGWRMSYQYLADRGPFSREKIWHLQNSEQPASIVPPLAHLSDGPSGLVHYPGTGMPAAYDGAFFLCDFRGTPSTSCVRQFTVQPQGATYRLASDTEFIKGVLATDCDFGPSGEFFVLDWVEGWEGAGVGRIHRVTCDDPQITGQRDRTHAALRQLATSTVPELIELLSHADMRVRLGAQQQLVTHGPESEPLLKKLATSQTAPLLARLHSIWALGELAESDPIIFSVISQLCGDDNTEVRAQAAKTLGRAGLSTEQVRLAGGRALLPLLADAAARVRSFAAISIGKLQYRAALPELLQLARENGGDDPTLRHAAAMGLAGSQSAQALVDAANGATVAERLTLVVALGKQESPLVARLLADDEERVVLEAARVIWDTPLPDAANELAAMLNQTRFDSEPLLRRALAANVAARTSANLQALVNFACRSDLSPMVRDLAWELVGNWAAPSSRDSVHGDWRPLAPRPPEEVSGVLRTALPKIVEASTFSPAGLVFAAEMRVEDSYIPLIDVVTSELHSPEVRARGLAAFRNANDSVIKLAIDAGLKSRSTLIRSAARQLLMERFPAQAMDQIRETIDTGTLQEQQAVIDMLAALDNPTARDMIRGLIERLENGTCAPELQIEILEAASRSTEPAIAERARKFAEKQASAGRVNAFSACLSGGDASRGKKVFTENEALSCRRCHSVKPGQALMGPSLADIGAQRTRPELLESLVSPNVKISEGFQTVVLQLDSGKIVSGVVLREDDKHIVLIDAETKEIVVETATVEERTKGISAMPDNLIDRITQRELRDLVAYLSQLRIAGSENAAPAPEGE